LETAESLYAMVIMCLLKDGKAYSGCAFKVELDEKSGPFRGDPKACPGYLEGRLDNAIEGATYVPEGYEACCVCFFGLF
jgi:hypothetical protein